MLQRELTAIYYSIIAGYTTMILTPPIVFFLTGVKSLLYFFTIEEIVPLHLPSAVQTSQKNFKKSLMKFSLIINLFPYIKLLSLYLINVPFFIFDLLYFIYILYYIKKYIVLKFTVKLCRGNLYGILSLYFYEYLIIKYILCYLVI